MDHSPPSELSDRNRDNTDPQQRLLPGWRRWQELLPLLLIVAVGLGCYANTFSVPLLYDDFGTILNPVVENFSKIFALNQYRELGIDEDLRNNLITRMVTYASFALNYRLHQLWLPGFHLVNLLIHLCNALQIYLLVRLTARLLFRPDGATATAGTSGNAWKGMALFAALLFVAHPIQTNAVTYLSQRFTSLCTFFYLLALLSYIGSVLTADRNRQRLLYGTALGATVLAMYSKEIAFTLPVMIALYDIAFLPGPPRRRWLRLGPILLTLILIPITVLWLASTSEITGNQATQALDLVNFKETSRWHYLLTQTRVLVTYLRLLIWPADLNFDYDFPLLTSLANWEVLTSIGLLALLLITGIRSLCRCAGPPQLRLAGFGIIWFFVTISVSSSIVPLVDLILEYRLYLPSVGLFIAGAAGADLLVRQGKNRSRGRELIALGLALGMVVSLAAATFLRNRVWQDKVVFWEDVVAKSPGKKRPHFNLAAAYLKVGRSDEAAQQVAMIESIGKLNAAGYYHLATIYTLLGQNDAAKTALLNAVRLEPEEAFFHAALGEFWLQRGDTRKAANAFQRAQSLDPEDPYLTEVLENLKDETTQPGRR